MGVKFLIGLQRVVLKWELLISSIQLAVNTSDIDNDDEQ